MTTLTKTTPASAFGAGAVLELAGRAGLAAIFVTSGLQKLGSYAGTTAWI